MPRLRDQTLNTVVANGEMTPCGTLITYAGSQRDRVGDRLGPLHRGSGVDLTGASAAALAFPGMGQIEWTVVG